MPVEEALGSTPASRFGAELETALLAAADASAIALVAFPGGDPQRPGRRRRNGPHDVVTRTDAAVERQIRSILLSRFPDDGFIGEETSPRRPRETGRSQRSWIVDPIDGTVSFVSGIPFFSVSIALADRDRVRLGVVADPVRGEAFIAVAGAGAGVVTLASPSVESPRRRGPAIGPTALVPRRLAAIGDAVVSLDPGDPDDVAATARVDGIRKRVRAVRTLGSTALSLCWAASGRLDGVLQVRGLQAVDIAAAGLVAREAGLRISDAEGGPWLDLRRPEHGRGIAAARLTLHRMLVGR